MFYCTLSHQYGATSRAADSWALFPYQWEREHFCGFFREQDSTQGTRLSAPLSEARVSRSLCDAGPCGALREALPECGPKTRLEKPARRGHQTHVQIIHLTDRAPTARFNSWFNGRDSSRIAPSLRWVFVPSAEQNNWISQVVLCQSVRGANGREPYQVLNIPPVLPSRADRRGLNFGCL